MKKEELIKEAKKTSWENNSKKWRRSSYDSKVILQSLQKFENRDQQTIVKQNNYNECNLIISIKELIKKVGDSIFKSCYSYTKLKKVGRKKLRARKTRRKWQH